jgi:hypothetical protein
VLKLAGNYQGNGILLCTWDFDTVLLSMDHVWIGFENTCHVLCCKSCCLFAVICSRMLVCITFHHRCFQLMIQWTDTVLVKQVKWYLMRIYPRQVWPSKDLFMAWSIVMLVYIMHEEMPCLLYVWLAGNAQFLFLFREMLKP